MISDLWFGYLLIGAYSLGYCDGQDWTDKYAIAVLVKRVVILFFWPVLLIIVLYKWCTK